MIPTPAQLREAFKIKFRVPTNIAVVEDMPLPPKQADFWTLFREFVLECGTQNSWSESTYRKFGVVKNHLFAFRERLTFDYFDDRGLNRYVTFLRDERDMRNSTISKQLAFLKWYLRWALRKGYTTNSDFELYKPKIKSVQKRVIFLTQEELTRLREFEIPDEKLYLDRVRDVFLFLCFTGLRHSDAYNLRRSDIKENHIEVTTIKTNDNLHIELNKQSRAILEKYKDVAFEGDKALPIISNQKSNDYSAPIMAM